MNLNDAVKKMRAIIRKGPATARNILFSQFNYWPTRWLENEEVRNLPVYCVSLPTALRRRQIITRQANQMGLSSLSFVDAVVLSDADVAELREQGVYDDEGANRWHHRSLTNSEIACSLSHGRTYDMIVSLGHEVAMVIEDDCLFVPAQLERVDIDALPEGWDIAFLNSFIENGRPRRRLSGNLYCGDAWTGSCAAYLLSKKGAERLAAEYKPVVHAADGYAGRNDFERYMYYPDCALNGSVCYYYRSSVDSVGSP